MSDEEPASPSNERSLWEEIVREDRRALWTADLESAKAFDQALLALAAGGFGLSVSVVKDIRNALSGADADWLYVSWIGFLGTLLVTLISFQSSQAACREQISLLEADLELRGPNPASSRKNWQRTITQYLNRAAITFLVAGAISLAVFVDRNVIGGNAMPKTPNDYVELKKGYVPPTFVTKKPLAPQKEGYVPPAAPKKSPPSPPPDKKK